MKLKLIILSLLLLVAYGSAQKLQFGTKVGLNFPQKPDIDVTQTTLSEIHQKVKSQKQGYHVGVFTRFSFLGIYMRPELYLSHFKSEFIDANNSSFYIKQNRIDLPVLVGNHILDIAYFHGGLVGSYYFNDDINIAQINITKEDHFTIGLQIGGGVNLGDLSLDIRWEKAINEKILAFATSDSEYHISSNPSQFLFSLGFKF